MGKLTTAKPGSITCPLCKRGKVSALLFNAVEFKKVDGYVSNPVKPKERIKVISGCSECGATAEQIMASLKK